MEEKISLIAQSAIRIENESGKVIFFDPYKLGTDYKDNSDYIFVTHPHYDHFSEEDIKKIKNDSTKIIVPTELEDKARKLGFENILLVEPNKEYEIDGIKFETIPAYNTNKDFHKKEYNWVGYVVTTNGKRVYVSGDTDNTEEARKVKCDIACVPVGGTYTMTADEAVELIKEIKPELAIPTHYETLVGTVEDAYRFKQLLEDIVNVKILMK